MCFVSLVITDFNNYNWKFNINKQYPLPQDPTLPNAPIHLTPEQVEALKKFLQAAIKLDKAAGEPDCEDPQKVADFKEKTGIDFNELKKDNTKVTWTWSQPEIGKMWLNKDGIFLGQISWTGEDYKWKLEYKDIIRYYLTKEHAMEALEKYA